MSKEILGGKNVALEILRAGRRKVFRIFWARRAREAASEELVHLAQNKNIPIQDASPEKISNLCGTEEHQGVAVEVSAFEYADFGDVVQKTLARPKGGFLVLLDEIQDPHNVGALMRTAHLCGASGVVLLKHRQALVTNAVCKAAAGAQEYLPIVQETNLVNVINYLKDKEFFIWGAAGEGVSLDKQKPVFPLALVVGSEGRGLRRLVRENCDTLVSIPMEGAVGSFNVSVAGGILMAEIAKTRRFT